ncbi:MAG: hypothetical protein KTR28_06540 [Micavibrio sp.]|nr:hypothetical protein [Micavibrio sp.]
MKLRKLETKHKAIALSFIAIFALLFYFQPSKIAAPDDPRFNPDQPSLMDVLV